MALSRTVLLAAVVVVVVVVVVDQAMGSTTCDAMAKNTDIKVLWPQSIHYVQSQTQYWSTAAGDEKPACILEPKSAEEVSVIVKTLLTSTEAFAIKSGGHNPNNNFSSVAGGPLISMAGLDEVVLDGAAQTVRLGPGNRWDRVADVLKGTGFTVLGGRIGNVGVGGFMLGGGLSFLSTQHGWAANNVLEYELVTANGTVLTVSKTTDPDLFLALKVGGNNFGIVTSYLVSAYPQADTIWGGTLSFLASPDTDKKMLAAIANFTTAYPDPKAAIIPTASRGLLGTVDVWVLFLFYDGPSRPPGIFDAFFAIGPLTSTCVPQSYASLLSANDAFVLKGSVYVIGTETTALPPAADPVGGLKVLEAIHAHWRDVIGRNLAVPGVVASIAYQPFPRQLARLAAAMGGDLYAMDDGVDRILLEMDYSFWNDSDAPTVDQALQDSYGGIGEVVAGFQRDKTLPPAYLPLFMNDGYFRQDIYGRMRPKMRDLAVRVRDEVDPLGLWVTRTGGFKISK